MIDHPHAEEDSTMADETKVIQQVISRYHQAITDKDLKTTLSCIGPTYFQGFRMPKGGNDPTAWAAGTFTTLEEVRKRIAKAFKSPDSTYINQIEFLHTSVSENAALVVTKETGKGQIGSWKGVINLWCMAKVRGRWKIVGSLHHIGKGRISAEK
jgi:ketosteroid isomerase-like protein